MAGTSDPSGLCTTPLLGRALLLGHYCYCFLPNIYWALTVCVPGFIRLASKSCKAEQSTDGDILYVEILEGCK